MYHRHKNPSPVWRGSPPRETEWCSRRRIGDNIENKIAGKKVAIIKDRGTYAIEVKYMFLKTSEEDTELGFTRQW